ncbi:tRNA-splicing endonuclease subunit [Myotisia sp. PD_48]|nr:tRNA-splicing endonuclease subunit [Myotisia sp. PD_48]
MTRGLDRQNPEGSLAIVDERIFMDENTCHAVGEEPELPIPISNIAGHYFLFSVDAVTYLRREHHIGGVLVGTLPQVPQQNVFLGLPVELMPEEARLLVDKKVAYVVDDVQTHSRGVEELHEHDRQRYMQTLELSRRQATVIQENKQAKRKETALKKMKTNVTKKEKEGKNVEENISDQDPTSGENLADESLFFTPSEEILTATERESSKATINTDSLFSLTPATSHGLFPSTASLEPPHIPEVPSSYPLYAYLHGKGYFLSPGLRFGCQYLAYPGDSLRFHSHFLVVSAEWDEEFDLMDLVAGGRLGTGVKKGYLIGGAETPSSVDEENTSGTAVRAFSIEWAGI